MNCYNHHSITAVAVCKNCGKGLCPECLTEVENGIACTATCIDEVKIINSLINKNKGATGRAVTSYYRLAFIFIAMSLLFFYSAFAYYDMRFYSSMAGVVFLIGGLLYINMANKYKKA